MAWSEGFAPQVSDACSVLVLGSLPGIKSLQDNQYYAHPRNAFWGIMQDLFGINKELPYLQRLDVLNRQGIGLWDVYHRCYRKGSLDSAIKKDSAELNDFVTLFNQFPRIQHVFFNGEAAATAFKKHIKPQFSPVLRGSDPLQPCLFELTKEVVDTAKSRPRDLQSITFYKLPSTSPANAATSVSQKIEAWKKVQQVLL